jgi:hypothetical protein
LEYPGRLRGFWVLKTRAGVPGHNCLGTERVGKGNALGHTHGISEARSRRVISYSQYLRVGRRGMSNVVMSASGSN